jgi:hypothetical protein
MDDHISFYLLKKSIKYVELITAIVGTIYFFKYKHTFLKYFLIILWYIVCNEFLGLYIKTYISENNIIIYNIFHFINFTYLFLLFRQYVTHPSQKRWIFFFIIIYILSFIINMFFENYFKEIQTIPYLIASVFLISSIVFYFLAILNTDKILYVSKNLLFWISVGLLIYFVGNIPFRVIRNFNNEISNIDSIFITSYILCIIMNICFVFGFIWSKKDSQY